MNTNLYIGTSPLSAHYLSQDITSLLNFVSLNTDWASFKCSIEIFVFDCLCCLVAHLKSSGVCVYFSSQITSFETLGNCFKVVLIMDSAKSRYWRQDVQCPVLYLTPANSIVANDTFALNVCGISCVLRSINWCTCMLFMSLSVRLTSFMQLFNWASIARGILKDLNTLGLERSGFDKACAAFPSDVKQSICLAFFSTLSYFFFCFSVSLNRDYLWF